MSISKENKERINTLFKTNPEMIEKLCNWDEEAIRQVASISQGGINPNDVIVAYESGDPNAMNSLYQQSKRLVGLQELYKDLCFEYCNKANDTSRNLEDVSNNEKNAKKI